MENKRRKIVRTHSVRFLGDNKKLSEKREAHTLFLSNFEGKQTKYEQKMHVASHVKPKKWNSRPLSEQTNRPLGDRRAGGVHHIIEPLTTFFIL